MNTVGGALAWSKMQTALLRIWTELIESISYNNNHYIMGRTNNYK